MQAVLEWETLIKTVKVGTWTDEEKQRYKAYYLNRDKLIMKNKQLYYENRFVPDYDIRKEILRRSHLSHNGIRKTYELIADLYWWPLLKKDIESMIYNCKLCQESNRTLVTSQTLIDSENFCWQPMKRVFLEIAGPFSGDN